MWCCSGMSVFNVCRKGPIAPKVQQSVERVDIFVIVHSLQSSSVGCRDVVERLKVLNQLRSFQPSCSPMPGTRQAALAMTPELRCLTVHMPGGVPC